MKYTTETFVEKLKTIHGDKFDYSKVVYEDSRKKVCVICPKHGEIWVRGDSLLQGKGCKQCWLDSKRIPQEKMIERFKQIHKDKYDYSKVKYKDYHTKVCIICPEHGEFWQTPANHLMGKGCDTCGHLQRWDTIGRLTNEVFIERAIKVHGGKYDYSKVDLGHKDEKGRICIICPIHGEFKQTPNNHLMGKGCKKCTMKMLDAKPKEKIPHIKYTVEDFIDKAQSIHMNKYDYSKVEYVNNSTKVCIICPKHGEFWQTPSNHLAGRGCRKCAYNNISLKNRNSKENFIERAVKIHNNKYDYSKVEYTKNNEKVCIICPKHGEFWQTPSIHLDACGCPKCSKSRLERELSTFLTNHNIHFIEQADKKTLPWIDNLKPDFYLEEYNTIIECQGIQHFKPFKHFGWKNGLNEIIERDKRKYNLCLEHNVNILYLTSGDYLVELSKTNPIYDNRIFSSKEQLLEVIIHKNGSVS